MAREALKRLGGEGAAAAATVVGANAPLRIPHELDDVAGVGGVGERRVDGIAPARRRYSLP